MLHFRGSVPAALAAIGLLVLGYPALATEVVGSFSGIIIITMVTQSVFRSSGGFSYDTALYQPVICSFPECSLFAPIRYFDNSDAALKAISADALSRNRRVEHAPAFGGRREGRKAVISSAWTK
jgi:hypothetical protein